MKLSDFNTLAEAKAYKPKTYRKIGGNEASQILSLTGALDAIENAQTDTTVVEVITGVPTTVGALCRTIVRTTQGGSFATDPNTEDGVLNRGATAILVSSGVLQQFQSDQFYAKAETITTPFANTTEHEFQVAKGTVSTLQVNTTANDDAIYFTLDSATEKHNPRMTIANGTKIGEVYNVMNTGLYFAQIPTEFRGQTVFVDNAYNAISA